MKVRAPRRLSELGAPNDVPNCHLDKTTMDNSSMHILLHGAGFAIGEIVGLAFPLPDPVDHSPTGILSVQEFPPGLSIYWD